MLLFNLQLQQGSVIKRPSATCKTPYVADVKLENNMILAHSAALGCCGLADKDATVFMEKSENSKNVCTHKIMLSKITEKNKNIIIGINPKLAENIVHKCLELDLITCLKNHKSFEREKKFLNSRFDFAGIDANEKPFILEVKNVPLADYVDCLAKEKKGLDFSELPYNSKISYFPDGYRKKVKDTVSPRALKHIMELEEMVQQNYRSIICYVIQRTDVASFQPSLIDPIYREAVRKAKNNGVEIITIVAQWTEEGNVYFIKDDLPINI
jgi:DNA-binding sugar fermentation-stimulating protein